MIDRWEADQGLPLEFERRDILEMIVIPAIDIKNGHCVRLVEGREDSVKIYDSDPVETALMYERAGAEMIHVVDLDGAFRGAASGNRRIIREISKSVRIPVEVGGGIRSLDDIDTFLNDYEVSYVILGTVVVERPDILEAAAGKFGDAIIAGIDARGFEVSIRGWTEGGSLDARELAKTVVAAGVTRIIYTDIRCDGKLVGPNLEMTAEMARVSGVHVTLSGGISSLEDIIRACGLQGDGVKSVIVGKALYEKRFTLEEALQVVKDWGREVGIAGKENNPVS